MRLCLRTRPCLILRKGLVIFTRTPSQKWEQLFLLSTSFGARCVQLNRFYMKLCTWSCVCVCDMKLCTIQSYRVVPLRLALCGCVCCFASDLQKLLCFSKDAVKRMRKGVLILWEGVLVKITRPFLRMRKGAVIFKRCCDESCDECCDDDDDCFYYFQK